MDSGVLIRNLEISSKDVIDYLRTIPEEDWEKAFIQALEVGIFSLQRASSSQDTEFFKRQIESLISHVQREVDKIPQKVEDELVNKIGDEKGQVLFPIKTLTDNISAITTQKLDEVKNLLSEEIDPRKQTSTIGKTLNELKDLLNPIREDSVQKRIENAINLVTSKDGALSESVKSVVGESLKSLQNDIEKLKNAIIGEQSQQEMADKTTLKGIPFENEILDLLSNWKMLTGAELEHVGSDNKPGDVVIRCANHPFNSNGWCIVIEAKAENDKKGKKQITDKLKEAMETRKANASIFVSRESDGFAKEIGEWGEGELEHGPWVATLPKHLVTAIRYVVIKCQLKELHKSKPELDSNAVRSQVGRIQLSLQKIRNINTNITSAREAIGGIEENARQLREEIQDALSQIELELNKASLSVSENETNHSNSTINA